MHSPRMPLTLYNRLKIVVFTHFTTYLVFDRAEKQFSATAKGKHYVQFVRYPGKEYNQNKHFEAGIRLVAERLHPKTHYIGIIEDDFPLCAGAWPEVLRTIRDASREVPGHCGISIGQGGSGLIFKTPIYTDVLTSMWAGIATDIGIQDCLLGTTCKGCQIVCPPKLQMFHTGHSTSTLGSWYYPHIHQCGARHPFTSALDAIIL